MPFDWLNPSVAAKAGATGGRSTSKSKVVAARLNGSAPCAPGKRRGRPRKIEEPGPLLLAIEKSNSARPSMSAGTRRALVKEILQARAQRAIELKWAKQEAAERRKAARVPWVDLRRGYVTYLQSTERSDAEQERWYDKHDTHPLPRIRHERVYFRRLDGYHNLKARALHTREVPSVEHIKRYLGSPCTDRAARAIHFDIKLAVAGKPIKPRRRRAV